MHEDLDIVVTGFDVDQRQAETGLMRVFGLDAQHARRFAVQLPVVAKRCRDRSTADHFADALRSIGARVEVRPHGAASSSAPSAALITSLPAPEPQMVGQVRESVRVSRASDRAVTRFRRAEGLDELGDDPPIDLYNPSIPKAPAIPRDMHKMPNAALPKMSDRPPEWVVSDPLSLTPGAFGEMPEGLRPHTNAQLPPRGSPSMDSGMRPLPRVVPSERPRSIGMAHEAKASVRPGLSPHAVQEPEAVSSLGVRLRRRWPVLLALTVAVGVALHLGGILQTDAGARRSAWQVVGIRGGEHAEARVFLQDPLHEVVGIDTAKLRSLLDKLERAGAKRIYAIDIKPLSNGERAAALLVELPLDEGAIRTIRFHVTEALGAKKAKGLSDHGRYQVVTFR